MMYESNKCIYILKVCTYYILSVLRRKTIHVHELIACKCYISQRCYINCQKSSCKLFMFLRSAFLRSLCQLRCISNAPFGFWESIDKPSLQQDLMMTFTPECCGNFQLLAKYFVVSLIDDQESRHHKVLTTAHGYM